MNKIVFKVFGNMRHLFEENMFPAIENTRSIDADESNGERIPTISAFMAGGTSLLFNQKAYGFSISASSAAGSEATDKTNDFRSCGDAFDFETPLSSGFQESAATPLAL